MAAALSPATSGQPRQPVLRQHHAVGGQERLCRRQRHLPAGAAIAWPAGAEDLAAVVHWIASKIGERGGDPARIYLMGHSAGAVHVANYVSHPEFHKVKGGGLAGAIMVSGIYDLTASPLGDRRDRLFRLRSRRAMPSAPRCRDCSTTKIPLMITAAELDPPRFVEQFELAEAGHLQARRAAARVHLHAAAAQPHVGSVCDQHGGYAPDRRDSGVREDGEIAGAICTARRFSPRSGR